MISPDTRRVLFLIIVSFLLALPAVVANASAETVVRISPEVSRISENGNFSLAVVIEPDVAVSGAEFLLAYDPSLVKIIRVSEGTFLKQENEQSIFSSGSTDNVNGTVSGIYGFILAEETLLDAGTFASIEFSAVGKSGITRIELRNVTVTNSSGEKLPIVINNSRVLVGNVKDPEATQQAGHSQLAFGIFALAGMLLVSSRKR
ncbi:cohesin domain-containing protein [Methanolobus sp.]|uniref:cohesin domain-containing protein n=1 Tax=Methanolobus sp. TaxID=1874737 RepID=UPI0025D7E193|nr:cohesin domain-containing protein [Methanolobus sp.]